MGIKQGMSSEDMAATALCAVGRMTVIYEAFSSVWDKLDDLYADLSSDMTLEQMHRMDNIVDRFDFELKQMRNALALVVDDYD